MRLEVTSWLFGQSTPINKRSAVRVHGRWASSKGISFHYLIGWSSREINRELIVRVRFCEMECFMVINGVRRDGPDSRCFNQWMRLKYLTWIYSYATSVAQHPETHSLIKVPTVRRHKSENIPFRLPTARDKKNWEICARCGSGFTCDGVYFGAKSTGFVLH